MDGDEEAGCMGLKVMALSLVLCGATCAQTLPVFEVASIKPSAPTGESVIYRYTGGRFAATHVTLKTLILWAHDTSENRVIGGPAWVDNDRFDIVATSQTDAGSEQSARDRQIKLMVRALLAERFQLRLQAEDRDLPVYALVTGKSGANMTENSEKPYLIQNRGNRSRNKIVLQKVSMAQFANQLSGQFGAADLGRVVVDRTGLTGTFDLTLDWARSNGIVTGTDDTGPSIFTAVEEQLGLHLQPGKAPVPVLVITRAEKPSDN